MATQVDNTADTAPKPRRKKIVPVELKTQGNISLKVLEREGAMVPRFAMERIGGAVLPNETSFWVMSDVAGKLLDMLIMGTSPTNFRKNNIKAFVKTQG